MSSPLPSRVRRISRFVYAAIVVLVFVGDQASKTVVEHSIPLHAVIPVIPGLFNLTHTRNSGVAFGLFSEAPAPWKTALLVAVSAALLCAVVVVIWRSRQLQWEMGVGLSLVFGGAVSNLLDRLRYGRVVDFLDFYVRSYHWFTFNLADSAIVAGAGLLILQVFFGE